MPPLLAILPAIAAIGSLAGTGVGLGLELSNQPGKPKPPTITPPTAAQLASTQNQEKSLISQNAPNVLEQTSGLANPDYVAQISQLLAGTGGQTGSTGAARDVVSRLFGLPTGPGASPGAVAPPATPGATNFTPAGTASAANPASAQTPVALSDFVDRFIYG
jgi:hypothetical protein